MDRWLSIALRLTPGRSAAREAGKALPFTFSGPGTGSCPRRHPFPVPRPRLSQPFKPDEGRALS